jgi:hypothetical protein
VIARASLNMGKEKDKNLLPPSAIELKFLGCQFVFWLLCSWATLIVCTYYVFTYLLHGAVLLEKLSSLQLVRKFPAYYGTQRFISTFTSAHHPPLSWANSMQSIPHIPLLENSS